MNEKTQLKLTAAGHRVHAERGTYTHAGFDVGLNESLEVRDGGMPIYVERLGRTLRVSDVMPERRGLALDENANLLDQSKFAERYNVWWKEFGYMGNPAYEPVPNVKRFAMTALDPVKMGTDQVGWAEVGFDATEGGPAQETGQYNTDGEKVGESPALKEAELYHKMHADGDITDEVLMRKMGELFGTKPEDDETTADDQPADEKPIVGTPTDSAELPPEPDMAASGDAQVKTGLTPCGKELKLGGIPPHISRCQNPACIAEKEKRWPAQAP